MEYNSDPWYVIHTVPQREKAAAVTLQRAGAEVFNPRYMHRRVTRHVTQHVELPLFPRYIFARCDIAALWPFIVRERAILGPLKTAGSFDMVPDEMIIDIWSRVGENGLVKMYDDLEPGARVIVKHDRYGDLEGIYQREMKAEQRLVILLRTANDLKFTYYAERSEVIPFNSYSPS